MKLRWPKARKRKARTNEYRLIPPEGVPLRFEIAGLGARFGAQITDLLISGVFVFALVLLLAIGLDAPRELTSAIAALSFFLVRTPYYLISELLWNGATVGKRLMRCRVVSADGRALTAHAVTVRNLMKEAEVFVPGTLILAAPAMDFWSGLIFCLWIFICLAVPLFNRRRQRLGDIIAGTVVIQRPIAVLAPDLAAAPAAEKQEAFVFLPHQLEHYGAYELQTLETLLQSEPSAAAPPAMRRQRDATMQAVVARIRAKIDYGDAVGEAEAAAFLRAFYNAQRAYLEQRQLFGDKRADKHHRDAG